MNRFRIGSAAVLAAALTVAGCGPQEGGARVAGSPSDAAKAGDAAPAPGKKARTRVAAEGPANTGTSAVP
jgi:hypothetical protein